MNWFKRERKQQQPQPLCDSAVALEAWLIVLDEMVKVMRQGNTAWALGFLNGSEVTEP